MDTTKPSCAPCDFFLVLLCSLQLPLLLCRPQLLNSESPENDFFSDTLVDLVSETPSQASYLYDYTHAHVYICAPLFVAFIVITMQKPLLPLLITSALMTEGSSDMHDSLGLLHVHDQYFCGSSGLPHPFLPHDHLFAGRCGGGEVPEFVEPAAEMAEQEFAARKTVSGDGDGGSGGGVEGGKEPARATEEEAHGMRMITLLMECVVAMSVENLADANQMLLELTQTASPYAPSCAERLVAYFTAALATRLVSSWVGIGAPLAAPYASVHAAFRAFYNVAPFVRLAHLMCNQAILAAVHGKHRIHIVDLDAVPGGALQWLSLLPALAARPGGPPLVRMTGFGASASVLRDTGNQLAGLASKLGMPFEFYAVVKHPGYANVLADVPSRQPGEAVAVHWLRHSMYDSAGDDSSVMRLVQLLEPKVVTLVEQERGGDSAGHFLDRFVAALHYYSALFDSLGVSRPDDDDASRHLVERGILGREIGNVLAVGGPARTGEEKFASWRAELARHGFSPAAVGCGGDSAGAVARAQLMLGPCPPGLGYTVADSQDGTVRLGWKGTGLYAVSMWHSPPPPVHAGVTGSLN